MPFKHHEHKYIVLLGESIADVVGFTSNNLLYCAILAGLSNLKPLDVQFKYRFICFLKKCLDRDNATVKNVTVIALNDPMSCAVNNYRHILSKYQNVLNNPTYV